MLEKKNPRPNPPAETGAAALPVRRIVEAALLLAPLAYAAYLLTTLLHEVVGHGFVAWAVGGRFNGFRMALDGYAEAQAYALHDRTIWRSAAIYAGGIIVTFVTGYVLLRIAQYRTHKRPILAAVLGALGLSCLLDALPYLFWGSLYQTGYGDPAAFLELVALQRGFEQNTLRWGFVIVGGIGTIVTHIAGFIILTRAIIGVIGLKTPLETRQRAQLVAGFLVVPVSVLWLIFDWEQIVPGVGYLPNAAGVACAVLAGVICTLGGDEANLYTKRLRLAWPIVLAWIVALGLVGAIVVALNDGIYWGA